MKVWIILLSVLIGVCIGTLMQMPELNRAIGCAFVGLGCGALIIEMIDYARTPR